MAIAIYVLGPLHTATSGPKGTFLYSNYQWITSLYLPLPSDADWPADMSKRLLGMICCVASEGCPNNQYGTFQEPPTWGSNLT